MQAAADRLRADGRRLVLVPTMGSLHEGHLALVRAARAEGDHVTVSIFVNPTQFGPGEDFDRYPRDLEGDLDRLEADGGADAVFAPEVEALYPDGLHGLTWVTVDRMGDHLCGARRPGHFQGVATVVAKLFLACRPHVALFGLKDAQQFFILRRMAADLGFGVRLVGVETVREADGLALSSRNRYLDRAERAEAVVLSRAVAAARELLAGGERDAAAVTARMRAAIAEAPRGRLDYAELVDTRDLQPVAELRPGMSVLAAVAVHFGRTRLIDNAIVDLR
jgi:pantoate--beta-alanine ligase